MTGKTPRENVVWWQKERLEWNRCKPRNTKDWWHHQKLGGGKRQFYPECERVGVLLSPHLWLLPSRTVREIHFFFFKPFHLCHIVGNLTGTSINKCGIFIRLNIIQQLKGRDYWYILQHGWTLITWCQVKDPRYKRIHGVWFHLYEASRKGKLSETENRLDVAWGWNEFWGLTINRHEGSWGDWNAVKSRLWQWLCKMVNLLKIFELYTQNRSFFCM